MGGAGRGWRWSWLLLSCLDGRGADDGRRRVRRLHPERHLRRADRRSAWSSSRATATDDVEPYVAVGDDGEPVTLGYYGAPGVPGFGVAAIYTDQQFSHGDHRRRHRRRRSPAATSSEPDADQFGEAGLAVVQLLAGRVERRVQGVATIERTSLQRELDVTPDPGPDHPLDRGRSSVPAGPAAGLRRLHPERAVRRRRPTDLAVELEEPRRRPRRHAVPGRRRRDRATRSRSPTTERPARPASVSAAAYTDQDFSLVISDAESGEPVACGDILEPDDDDFTEAGLALVAAPADRRRRRAGLRR